MLNKIKKFEKMFEIKNNKTILKDKNKKLLDSIIAAHEDRFIQDWVYDTYHAILDQLLEYEYFIDTIEGVENVRDEVVGNLVDIYYSDLLKWGYEFGIANEEIEGKPSTIGDAVRDCQARWIDSIFDKVLDLLKK